MAKPLKKRLSSQVNWLISLYSEYNTNPQCATDHNMMNTKKHIIFALIILFTLTACGFKLRGQISSLPFKTLYIHAPVGQSIGTDVERAITASTTTKVVYELKKAEAALQIVNVIRNRRILSLSGAGRVSEFQLIFHVVARLVDAEGNELAPTNNIILTRNLPFLDAQILAKEAEEKMLYEDMQADAVQQIIWRLSSVKPQKKQPEKQNE